MKVERTSKINLVMLLLAIISILTYSSLSFAYDLKEYFPLGQEDNWIYSVVENGNRHEEIVEVVGKENVGGVETAKLLKSNNEYVCMDVDSEGIKQYKVIRSDEYNIFEPPLIVLPSNLETNEEREYTVDSLQLTSSGKGKDKVNITNRVSRQAAIDDMEVPAGKFSNCLKFESAIQWNAKDGEHGVFDCTFWLASGVGMVKKSCVITGYSREGLLEESSSIISELTSAFIDGKSTEDQ